MMRWNYAEALYMDDGATLNDLHEAVATLEEVERIARRVFGGAHPLTEGTERYLRNTRALLRGREESVRLRDELAAAQAASDALNAELDASIEASRLENARAALRASITRIDATLCALACAIVALLVALVFAVR